MAKNQKRAITTLTQTECKFCHNTVLVGTVSDQYGFHPGEQFLVSHDDEYGGVCVQGSGLMVNDNNKPLVSNVDLPDSENKYKHTLNLPRTNFPMRRSMAEFEVSSLKMWDSKRY